MTRTHDAPLVARAVTMLGDEPFDAAAWLADDRNIALADGGSVALFQWEGGHSYSAHWMLTARGREALALGRAMLGAMFAMHGALAVWGLTPMGNRAARLFNRWLGGVSHGVIHRPDSDCELFIMRKEQWASLAT